jgi:RimJ/RimL family protein N-acetyltransferase
MSIVISPDEMNRHIAAVMVAPLTNQGQSYPTFQIDDPERVVCRLQAEHTAPLQRLFDKCADFVMLVEGEEASPTAAQDIFQERPAGRSLDDKFLYGLVERNGEIVGLLEGFRHYPDEAIWWIGLLMLAPEVRGRGLGRKLVQSFCDYVCSVQGTAVMLGVVEENRAAYRFWQQVGFEQVRQTEPRPFGKKTQSVYVMRRALADEMVRTPSTMAP